MGVSVATVLGTQIGVGIPNESVLSMLFAMPSGGGNGKGYTTYIDHVSDISEKVLVIDSGAYPQAIALDKKAGMIYAQDHGIELKTFTSGGQHQKNYDLFRRGDGTREFLVHPDGYQVIVLAEPNIFAVELPQN